MALMLSARPQYGNCIAVDGAPGSAGRVDDGDGRRSARREAQARPLLPGIRRRPSSAVTEARRLAGEAAALRASFRAEIHPAEG
jgi:hypothetical protein